MGNIATSVIVAVIVIFTVVVAVMVCCNNSSGKCSDQKFGTAGKIYQGKGCVYVADLTYLNKNWKGFLY